MAFNRKRCLGVVDPLSIAILVGLGFVAANSYFELQRSKMVSHDIRVLDFVNGSHTFIIDSTGIWIDNPTGEGLGDQVDHKKSEALKKGFTARWVHSPSGEDIIDPCTKKTVECRHIEGGAKAAKIRLSYYRYSNLDQKYKTCPGVNGIRCTATRE